MSGDLNLGGNNLVSVGTVDGVDVSNHNSRHLPNGSDPLMQGLPIDVSVNGSNLSGIQNAFARSDHQHNVTITPSLIGAQPSGNYQLAGNYLLSGTTTTAIGEGSNLYFTTARVDSQILVNTTVQFISGLANTASTNASLALGQISGVSGVAATAIQTASTSGVGSAIYNSKSGTNLIFNSLSGLGSNSVTLLNGVLYISGVIYQPVGSYLSSGVTTSVIGEGSNLYYTDTRARAVVSGTGLISVTNGQVSTTATNYTDTNARAVISGASPITVTNGYVTIASGSASADGFISKGDWSLFNGKQASGNYLVSGVSTTTSVAEGNNLYYTDVRARAIISGFAPITVSNGGITIASGSASANGYISSGDWTAHNNKIGAISNLGTGSGIFSSNSGTTAQLRSIIAGSGIAVTGDVNSLTISSTGVNNNGSFGITIDGSGKAITPGTKTFITIPYNATINGWTLTADQPGSIVIDVKKSTYANYPTTASIAGSELPTLSSVSKNQDLNLTTWTTAISNGDIVQFVVNSASTVTKVNLVVTLIKS